MHITTAPAIIRTQITIINNYNINFPPFII